MSSNFKITPAEAARQIQKESFVELFKTKYEKFIGDKDLEKMISRAGVISKYMIENQQKITLLIGQVQAGKTASYSCIMSHLFDAGSNLMVVAPAVDNILLEQTCTRLEKTFGTMAKVFKINDIFNKKGKMKAERIIEALKNGEKVILLTLKQKLRLQQTNEVINIVSNLINMPVLIDDEGDQASFDNINTAENNAIFSEIKSLYKDNDLSMLTVTATPMPHIFVDADYEIKPDKAFYIEPGSSYNGIEYFMDPSRNIERIEEEDVDRILGKTDQTYPESFEMAVIDFFTTSAYKHILKGSFDTSSMLIHVERKIVDHFKIEGVLNAVIKDISHELNPKSKSRLSNHVFQKIQSIMIKKGMTIPSELETFIHLIYLHVEKLGKTVIVNASNEVDKETIISSLHDPEDKNYIFIGSTMLQRGVTIKNLVVTYFAYRSNGKANADSVLQRARWFGYREMPELISLYMDDESMDDFNSLALMIPDMIARLNVAEKSNLSFKEYERNIVLPFANMRATRVSVINNDRAKLSNFITNNSAIPEEISESIFNRLLKIKRNEFVKNHGDGVSFADHEEFKEFFYDDEYSKLMDALGVLDDSKDVLDEYIDRKNPKFHIALMQNNDSVDKYTRKRNLSGKSFVVGQGRSKKDAKNYYVGDRYWTTIPKFNNSVILQISKIQDTNDVSKIIYKSALVFPSDIHSWFIKPIE